MTIIQLHYCYYYRESSVEVHPEVLSYAESMQKGPHKISRV